jgi:DNA polymerase-3 subunit epsilon
LFDKVAALKLHPSSGLAPTSGGSAGLTGNHRHPAGGFVLLFFDTETSGLPRRWNAPTSDLANWPRLVQLGWVLVSPDGQEEARSCRLVKPEGLTISYGATRQHGISTEYALRHGEPLQEVLDEFRAALENVTQVVGHNISFDLNIVGAELLRQGWVNALVTRPSICTMREGTDYCQLPGRYGYKWPTLTELHFKLFGTEFESAHDALADTEACMRCYFELRNKRVLN